MMKLSYLAPTELLEDIYATLCSVYEDEQHYQDEEKKAIQITKDHLTKKLMNEFVVDDQYFLTMEKEEFEKSYGYLQNDFLALIKGCSENNLAYESFLQIIDLLISSSKMRINAFEILEEAIHEQQQVQEEETGEEAGEE